MKTKSGVCDIMYDYDVVKKVLGTNELGVPLIYRKDCLGGAVIGKSSRNLRSFLRVFVCESDLRNCVGVIGKMTWGEFSSIYSHELRRNALSLNSSKS